MNKSYLVTILGVFVLFVAGCAGSAVGGKQSTRYLSDVGVATSYGFKQQAERILIQKHHFRIQRTEESGNRLYFETDWQTRQPFQDEWKQGVVDARTRIILEARPHVRTGASTTLKVKFVGENMLLFKKTGNWESGYVTQMCKNYFRKIALEFKTEFST
ncbi:MAG: hypothetical protein ACE5G1_00185, partial [bacterium]